MGEQPVPLLLTRLPWPQVQPPGEAEGELWHPRIPLPRGGQLRAGLLLHGHVEHGRHHLHAVRQGWGGGGGGFQHHARTELPWAWSCPQAVHVPQAPGCLVGWWRVLDGEMGRWGCGTPSWAGEGLCLHLQAGKGSAQLQAGAQHGASSRTPPPISGPPCLAPWDSPGQIGSVLGGLGGATA